MKEPPKVGATPFSPREFYKWRRPERFPDSTTDERPALDRTLLEYTLSTITNRSEELAFEDFARELAKREVAPNLLPHTGPSGGGDSKVDSETYPVAPTLSLSWTVGVLEGAASERWAFAFSAKAEWKSKLRSDIAKLVNTRRGYTKAFFISNQFIRDRVRAEIEDSLRKKHSIDVRIFDRSWILDRVFTGGHLDLAVAKLGISVSHRATPLPGPRDAANVALLTEIEARISAAVQAAATDSSFVDDCVEAFLLARDLGRERTSLEGLWARADRAASERGTRHQRLLVAYHRAWTSFWFFEDYRVLIQAYGDVEEHALASRTSNGLERLRVSGFS